MITSGYIHNRRSQPLTCMIEPEGRCYDVPPNGKIKFTVSAGEILQADEAFEFSVFDEYVSVWLMGRYDFADFRALSTDAQGNEIVAEPY